MIFSSLDYIHNDHFYHHHQHHQQQHQHPHNDQHIDHHVNDNGNIDNDERHDTNNHSCSDECSRSNNNNDNKNNNSGSSSHNNNNNSSSSSSNNNNKIININLNNTNISIEPKQLIYLTSDATDILYTLDKNCTYIIGGIVDRNKYKNLTYHKAKHQNIRTAKLPIHEYFHLTTTHILTINHVYEILLNFSKSKNWYDAIKQVIPARKGLFIKNNNNNNNDDDNK